VTPFFLALYSTAIALSAIAGALRSAGFWLTVLRALLLIASAVAAAQLFLVRFVTWCFTYHDVPRTLSDAMLPLGWLLLVLAIVLAGFALGRRLRFHLAPRRLHGTQMI
jgi:hypothetical protein